MDLRQIQGRFYIPQIWCIFCASLLFSCFFSYSVEGDSDVGFAFCFSIIQAERIKEISKRNTQEDILNLQDFITSDLTLYIIILMVSKWFLFFKF